MTDGFTPSLCIVSNRRSAWLGCSPRSHARIAAEYDHASGAVTAPPARIASSSRKLCSHCAARAAAAMAVLYLPSAWLGYCAVTRASDQASWQSWPCKGPVAG